VEKAFKNLGRFRQTMYECGYKPLLRRHKDYGEKWKKTLFWESPWLNGSKPKDIAPIPLSI
jgi:hypothetical protein